MNNDEMPFLFDDDALDAARSRRLKVLGGVTALAAMAVVAVGAVVVGGSGEPNDVAAPVPAAATAEPDEPFEAAEPDDAGTDVVPVAEGDEPPRTTEIFSSKNPFVPLVDTTPAAPASADPAATPTDTTDPATGVTVSTLVPEAPAERITEPRVAQRIEVLDVFTDEAGRTVANVKVNDTLHERVAEGDTFATSYKVVSLSLGDKCGSFLYGDDAFKLCVGEQLLK